MAKYSMRELQAEDMRQAEPGSRHAKENQGRKSGLT